MHALHHRSDGSLNMDFYRAQALRERGAYLGSKLPSDVSLPSLTPVARRRVKLFVAAFIVASGAFWATMLTDPPQTEASVQNNSSLNISDIAIPSGLLMDDPADPFWHFDYINLCSVAWHTLSARTFRDETRAFSDCPHFALCCFWSSSHIRHTWCWGGMQIHFCLGCFELQLPRSIFRVEVRAWDGAAALHLMGRSYTPAPQVSLVSLYERFGASRLDKVAQRVLETRGEVAVYCPFSQSMPDWAGHPEEFPLQRRGSSFLDGTMSTTLVSLPYLVLLSSVFAGAVVSSFAGFAFSPVAGVALLYFFPHSTVIPLLMLCSVVVQATSLIYFRKSLTFRNVGPMFAGGAVGVALAIFLFKSVEARTFQIGFGLFLALYAAVMLWRPCNLLHGATTPVHDTAVGFAGGIVGGFTAMPGAVPVLYCDLRGQSKEVQRATVQPFILGMQVLALALFLAHGDIGHEVVSNLVDALPALAAGVVLGLALFGRVPDAQFRRVVLSLLLITGVALALWRALMGRLIAAHCANPFFDGLTFAGFRVVFAIGMEPLHGGSSLGWDLPRWTTHSAVFSGAPHQVVREELSSLWLLDGFEVRPE